jgi:rSAM/selenodomain-associated transferase 2
LISVVIPTLNEEAAIGPCLSQLPSDGSVDAVVVDGGSMDRTAERARAFPHVRFVAAQRGRGSQMNEGARLATGDILMFLHADSGLPDGWAEAIDGAMTSAGTSGGWFRLRTTSPERGAVTNLALRLCDLRPNVVGQPWGDCAFFVRREVFETMGGYRDIPLMEDCDFAERLAQHGRIARLPLTVTTSGRRFATRPVRTTLMTLAFPILFRLGVSPTVLDRLYGLAR